MKREALPAVAFPMSMPCPWELVREDTAGSDWGTKKWVSEGTVKVEERRDDWKGHDVRALSFLLIGSHVPSYQLFLSPALISLSERGMSDHFLSLSLSPFSLLFFLWNSRIEGDNDERSKETEGRKRWKAWHFVFIHFLHSHAKTSNSLSLICLFLALQPFLQHMLGLERRVGKGMTDKRKE